MLGKKQKRDFDRTALHQVKAKPMKGPGIPASLGLRKAPPAAFQCTYSWSIMFTLQVHAEVKLLICGAELGEWRRGYQSRGAAEP